MNSADTPNEDKISINKYILDPLSVIIKLAILSKKVDGCKISVYNNTVFIQEAGVFQSFVRYLFKNNKVDIQYLYNPIELACIHFLSTEYVKTNPKIKTLFKNSQKGIQTLIDTYKNFTIITHTLFMYYNIIENHLGEIYNDKLFIKDNISSVYNNEIIKKLHSIWTPDRIKIVLNMIEFIDIDNGTEKSSKSVKCLEEFMIIIDQEIQEIVN
jgi:hypothetical protein